MPDREPNAGASETDSYRNFARSLPLAEQIQGLLLRRARSSIVALLRAHGAREVLDVCCGTGCLACRLRRSDMVVTALDSSPTMLERAKDKRRGSIHVLRDSAHLDYAGQFDAAVISLALHEMDPATRMKTFEGMRRAVRPGGVLVALDYTVAASRSWPARALAGLIEHDERAVGKVHAPHYGNFRAFMSQGGLEGWLERQAGCTVLARRLHLGGNLAVVALAA